MRYETYIDGIIERPVLSNGDNNRLMVRSRVDGWQFVNTSGETVGNIGGKKPIDSSIVQSFKKCKVLRVSRYCLVNRIEPFDDNMGMALNLPLAVDLLWSSEVIFLGIDKESSLHVLDLHLDCERSVGFNSTKVKREGELGRRHVFNGGNKTDGGRVAWTIGDLFAIGDRELGDSQTEIDEVVGGSEGSNLAIYGYILTIVLEASGNDPRVESWRKMVSTIM